MKRAKIIKHLIRSAILFSILALYISCEQVFENPFEGENNSQTSADNKTYLTVTYKTSGHNRTIYPDEISMSDLINPELKGISERENEERTFDIVANPRVEILPGKWTFTLSAEYEYIYEAGAEPLIIKYSDTVSANIVQGTSNNVAFNLKPQGEYGGFKIKLNLSESSVDSVKASIKDFSDNLLDSKTFTFADGESKRIEYSKTNLNDSDGRLSQGTYIILFEFFAGNDPTPINQWESYICIRPSFISQATVSLNFNQIYEIAYKDADGNDIDFESGDYSGTVIKKYSQRSHFDFPVCTNPPAGKIFLGWKVSGGDVPFTKITTGTSGNKEYEAYFVDSVLYVSASGDDENHGFSPTSQLKTLDGACERIAEWGTSDNDWKIYIDGEVTGIPKESSGVNASYGHSEIPATITSENAKSILITGATTHINWVNGTVPNDLDTINRGSPGAYNRPLDSGSAGAKGNALVISTSVPVTITNLRITGGNTSGNGGGIFIDENATVSIGDGVLITKNRAGSNGGAIFNKGTLYIYGSAIIGDKTDRTNLTNKYASYSSTQNLADDEAANYASNGGGIYNGDPNASTYASASLIAKLYLGYKPGTTGLQEETFTGGIYYCGASSGGAISNAIRSEVYMASGNLKYNGVSSNGAGIKNDEGGRFEMSGGEISHNSASYGYGSIQGGGVCNLYSRSVFIMSGGKIIENQAWCTGGSANAKGGGVYNGGYMFMYGSAVIGEVPSTLPNPATATSSSFSNKSNIGGGIYTSGENGDSYGRLYIGYAPGGADGVTPVETELTGGIYYNYSEAVSSLTSKWGGGGIYSGANNGYGKFYMASGNIAYNATNDYGGGLFGHIVTLCTEEHNITISDNSSEKAGNAVYIVANNYYKFIIGGNLAIPSGTNDYHDIHIGVSDKTHYATIQIAGPLDTNFDTIITPTLYDKNIQLVNLTTEYQNVQGSTNSEKLAAESNKFRIVPEVNSEYGTTTGWRISSTTGKLEKTDPESQANDNQISIDIGYNTTDLDMRTSGTAGAYQQNGTVYTLKNFDEKFTIGLTDTDASNYEDFHWYLDDNNTEISTASSIIFGGNEINSIDISSWSKGNYDLYFECTKKSDNLKYSYTIQIKIQ